MRERLRDEAEAESDSDMPGFDAGSAAAADDDEADPDGRANDWTSPLTYAAGWGRR